MDILKNAFDELNISYNEKTIEKFEKYMNGVLEWNKNVNLTAITEKDEFVRKHFIDSVLPAACDEVIFAKKVIDIGTGAGFPGIPLAIIFPEKKFILMDSLGKRLKIIDKLCDEIGIKNVSLIHSRAEDLAHNAEHRQQYDLCVSRAVANLATLTEYCIPFVKKGGYFLAYKGRDAEEELKESKKALNVLGGIIDYIYMPKISDFEMDHKILVIKKEKDTPSKYPRKAGTPSKEPLK